jgi:hypothetical protein
MTAPKPIPPSAKLLVALSFIIAALNVVLAFAPMGFGFLTVFVAAVGVMLGGVAARAGLEKLGARASAANSVGVVAYILYMVSFVPSTPADFSYTATVVETGILADQMVFSKKVRAAGSVQGIRMDVDPCGNEWVVRVTGKPVSQIGVYVPSAEIRACLMDIGVGQVVDIRIRAEIRSLTGQPKAFHVLSINACTFEATDVGAVVKADACELWF